MDQKGIRAITQAMREQAIGIAVFNDLARRCHVIDLTITIREEDVMKYTSDPAKLMEIIHAKVDAALASFRKSVNSA